MTLLVRGDEFLGILKAGRRNEEGSAGSQESAHVPQVQGKVGYTYHTIFW